MGGETGWDREGERYHRRTAGPGGGALLQTHGEACGLVAPPAEAA